MPFSFMFWNVERFAGGDERTDRVQQHIESLGPDLFCLCEIRDKVALRSLLMDRLVEYDFGVTDGEQGIELLTGWRRGFFQQLLFTQRREFRAGSETLRPGALTSVRHEDAWFNFLFLHTDSGTSYRDYSNRIEMYDKIWSLKRKLDLISPSGSGSLGDFNTMGKRASGGFPPIGARQEISHLEHDADLAGMRMLAKSHDQTLAWKAHPSEAQYRYSNLDHVLATQDLRFRALSPDAGATAEVSVDGWNHLSDPDRTEFIEEISDHCSIYAELE